MVDVAEWLLGLLLLLPLLAVVAILAGCTATLLVAEHLVTSVFNYLRTYHYISSFMEIDSTADLGERTLTTGSEEGSA